MSTHGPNDPRRPADETSLGGITGYINHLHWHGIQGEDIPVDDITETNPSAELLVRLAQEEGFTQQLFSLTALSDLGERNFNLLASPSEGILLGYIEAAGNITFWTLSYNWRPREQANALFLTEGVEVISGVWAAHQHCTSGLRYRLARLRSEGSFIRPWAGLHPEFTLAIHGYDSDPFDLEHQLSLTRSRLAAMPQNIRELIGPALQ